MIAKVMDVLLKKNVLIWLSQVLVTACRILRYSTWDLVP